MAHGADPNAVDASGRTPLKIAIEQKQPPKETVDMMSQLVDRAKEIKKLSEPEAAKGNYKEAILMLQGATDRIQQALKVVGVR